MKDRKYYFHVLVSNIEIFEENCHHSIEVIKELKLFNVELLPTFNLYNEFPTIRIWINSILQNIYLKKEDYFNSYIFFIHQDTFIYKNFLNNFEKLINKVDTAKTGLIGFAGIDRSGVSHKFMIDSGSLSLTYDFAPLVVDSVDEFIFAINASIFIKHQLELSNIFGWHAYSAEFSILLRKLGYDTYYFPLFAEHNSIRSNNSKIAETHIALYRMYGVFLRTLVGNIELKSVVKKFLSGAYSFYVDYFKYGRFHWMIEYLKYALVGKLPYYHNFDLLLNKLILQQKEVQIYVFCSFQDCFDPLSFRVKSTNVSLHFFSELCQLPSKTNIPQLVLGVPHKLKHCKFYSKSNINYKK